MHPKFGLRPHHSMGHTMCGSMVDIQSATAEEEKDRKKIDRRRNHTAKI